MLCFCSVQSFMFYEGYNIDSEGSTVNIRVGKKTPFSMFMFAQQLYVDLVVYNMNIYIRITLEPKL